MSYPKWLNEIKLVSKEGSGLIKRLVGPEESLKRLLEMSKHAWNYWNKWPELEGAKSFIKKYSDKPQDWLESKEFFNHIQDLISMIDAEETEIKLGQLKQAIRDHYKEEKK